MNSSHILKAMPVWLLTLNLVGLASSPEAAAQDSSPLPQAAQAPAPDTKAPESAASAPPSVVASADAAASESVEELLADVDRNAQAVAGIRRRLGVAPPAAKELLKPQLEAASSAYRRALADAASALSGAEGESLSAADARKAQALLSSKLHTEGLLIHRELDEQYRETVQLISKIEKSKKEERAELEKERDAALQQLPELLGEYDRNLEAQALLKLNTASAVAAFKKELKDRAKFTSGTLKTIAEDIDRLKRSQSQPPTPQELAQLSGLSEYRKLVAELQRKHVTLMDSHGLDTVQERQDLITSTGEVTEDILDADVLGGLLKKWKADAIDTASEHAPSIMFRLLSVCFILLLFWGLARLAKRLVRRALARPQLKASSLATDFFVKMTGRLIIFVGLIVATAQLGIEVAPLLAGLGIAGFVVGFALQDTLSNFASGMMILVYRPFDVGDVIEAGGTVGKVQAMTLVSTSVLTFDNQMLIVPNNKIWGDTIRNLTYQTTRRVDLVFGISYADDIEHAERVLNGILEAEERVLDDPAPIVRVHELGDSSVNFVVRPWVKTEDYWEVYWAITREVKRRFDAEGVSIPFPQRDVHVYEERLALRTVRDSDVAPKTSGDATSAKAKGA